MQLRVVSILIYLEVKNEVPSRRCQFPLKLCVSILIYLEVKNEANESVPFVESILSFNPNLSGSKK